MTIAEFEPKQPSLDQIQLEQGVHQLGYLYGISGLEVEISPGNGTYCTKLDNGLRVTIDPRQFIEGGGHNLSSPENDFTSPEVTALFMTAHELGHAKDYLDPAWRLPVLKGESGAFFDCLIDDTVIDKRSRRIPLFDANADAVYAHQIPGDLTKFPKHVQLMYGIRISEVVNDPQLEMSADVRDILTGLRNLQKDANNFDLPAVLSDQRTKLAERRQIANTFILPHYEALLAQDNQEQQNGDAESSESNTGDFKEIYDKYQQTVHGHRHNESGNNESSEPSSESHDLAKQISEALKQLTKEQNAKKSSQSNASPDPDINKPGNSNLRKVQLAELAGKVAAEMELEPGYAESYVRSLNALTPTIKEVAKVFMSLAAPAKVVKSPRYTRGAHSEGIRFHPRAMAGLAFQLATDQEQAIWQRVERNALSQDITFAGLDIHLMVDVSGSMAGEKAQCAADTALCLIEGLQLARYKVTREVSQSHQPDVRTQIIAFGSGTDPISPLAYEPTGHDKGKTYTNLLHPKSTSTLINGSLELVQQSADINPKRDVIAIIVSDGRFGDHETAAQTMATMPKSVYVAHLVMGNEVQKFLSNNHEAVDDPSTLPGKLYGVLAEYIRRTKR